MAQQKSQTGEDPLETSQGPNLTHEQRCNQAILQNMSEVLKDKVFQVINKSFPMVSAYITLIEKSPGIQPKSDTSIFETFLMNFLERLADLKTFPKVNESYTRLFKVQQLDCAYLIAFLLKPQSFINKKSLQSHKHLTPRFTIILGFLKAFSTYEDSKRITKQTFPTQFLLPHIKSGLEANNQELRQISHDTLVEMYKVLGMQPLELFISDLSLKTLTNLEKDIPEAKQYIQLKKNN